MARSPHLEFFGFFAGLLFLLLPGFLSGSNEGTLWAKERGAIGSVGLQVVPTVEGELVVLRVLDDSPAYRGGIRPGDLIVSVDGFALKGSRFEAVVQSRLWGDIGTSVKLIFLRPGRSGRQGVVLKRSALPETIPEATGVRILPPSQKQLEGKEKGH